MNKILKSIFGQLLVGCSYICAGNFYFAGPNSAFRVLSGTTVQVTNQLSNNNGLFQKQSGSTWTSPTSGVKLLFTGDYATFENAGNALRLLANYNVFGTNNMLLAGSQSIVASPSSIIDALTVSGTTNKILGMPTFTGTPTLASGAELQLGIENDMSANLALASGTLTLLNDLTWADGKQPTGTGTIKLNSGYKFILGSTPLTFASAITWQGTGEIVLKAKTTLTATWTFSSGNVVINGNGNILDISSGGLSVASGVTVYLSNVYVKGVGSTRLSGAGGTFRLSGSTLEMNAAAAYSSTGSIYVDGNSTIIMKGNALSFAGSSVLTVDGCTLWYDTQNTSPSSAGPTGNVTLTNTGVVLDVRGYIPALGNVSNTTNTNLTFAGATTLNYDVNLSDDHTLTISATGTINGNGHRLRFSNNKSSQLTINTGVTATFTNCIFDNFADAHLNLVGTGAIVFGSGCRVNAMSNDTWTKAYSFGANTVLCGAGGIITLSTGTISSTDTGGTGLRILDLTIAGVSGTNISCSAATAKIIFDGVILSMTSANWTWGTGFFEVTRSLEVRGPYTFVYQSTATSTINAGAELAFTRDSSFQYSPASGNSQITLTNNMSRLRFENSTLTVSTVGLILLNGTLVVSGVLNISSAATNDAQAIVFGNGTLANDLNVILMPGAQINLTGGILLYKNKES